MQFVTDGPDIPDWLLQAHEEGRVVFFCGAGISYPAGLPGFGGLVKSIYELNSTLPDEIEKATLDAGQFDAALDLLERRLPGQRRAVRGALLEALKPRLRRKDATATHEALLQLALTRAGMLRIVTTNFDHVFQAAAKRLGQTIREYAAPMLPIPKNSRWDGLVYLHGLLPKTVDEEALHRLVLTSGDFGLAYLVERWAARFVSELFRNYVVCFVGYSINDPVLRYMMDALAADRMLGEVVPQAWAFGDCEPGQEHTKTVEWNSKGVTPILYHVPKGGEHTTLHATLHVWSKTYRDGVLGKERFVVSHAQAQPSASTRQDDFVGRMLWALSDASGKPAKRFAEFNPVPSLDWLEAFSKECFQHSDLIRFGVSPDRVVDEKLRFSLVQRPAPYANSQLMSLASAEPVACRWDLVMVQLGNWLVRHLADPNLVLWLAQRGAYLHDTLRRLIEGQLDHLAKLEAEAKLADLNNLRSNAPMSIPGPRMRGLWRLLLSGRVKSRRTHSDIYAWLGRLKREGLTTTTRLELRELLAPKLTFRKSFRGRSAQGEPDELTSIKQSISWELELTADHARSALFDLAETHWTSGLHALLEEFQQLLRDTLDLFAELGEANDRYDRSRVDLPSISPHWQNRGFHDWVLLIELLRDAWRRLHSIESARAARIATAWFELPYLTFKRLALFAASQNNCLEAAKWIDWLLADRAWCLWSINIGREVFRLLSLQGNQLTGFELERLEVAILAGPPRSMYRDDLDAEGWKELAARAVWLRLAKLEKAGASLGAVAQVRLSELSATFPQWQLSDNERDEFSTWMTVTGDPDFEHDRQVEIAPRKRRELASWLKNSPPQRELFYEDTWADSCRTRFFLSLTALRDLTRDSVWPPKRWEAALQVWSEDAMVQRCWRYAGPLVATMPDEVMREVAHSLTWWLEAVSKTIDSKQDVLLCLCSRFLKLPVEAKSGIKRNGALLDEPLMEALNHPVGHTTQALINLWFKRKPNDNDLLPPKIERLFTDLCNYEEERFRHGRALLGSQLLPLFRVDRSWTERHLLPLFGWNNADEARGVWEGFLWSARSYEPLLKAIKPQLLETARHYAEIGEHRQQFAGLLTYVALEFSDGYSVGELRAAIAALPQDGLEECARALAHSVEGAAEQGASYWKNRALPFWRDLWPKAIERRNARIAERLAQLSLAARAEFPAALTEVQHWLQPIEYPDYVVNLLQESGLCRQFPQDSLRLLNAILGTPPWPPRDLKSCLEGILNSEPKLAKTEPYQRISEYLRTHPTP